MYDLTNLAYSKVSPNIGRRFNKAEKEIKKYIKEIRYAGNDLLNWAFLGRFLFHMGFVSWNFS